MDLHLASFLDILKQLEETQHSLWNNLAHVDCSLHKMKTTLTDSAQLLLLHKALVRKLQDFQTQHAPVILKTRNTIWLEWKYRSYLDWMDSLCDTVGKSKLQSIKLKEGMAQ